VDPPNFENRINWFQKLRELISLQQGGIFLMASSSASGDLIAWNRFNQGNMSRCEFPNEKLSVFSVCYLHPNVEPCPAARQLTFFGDGKLSFFHLPSYAKRREGRLFHFHLFTGTWSLATFPVPRPDKNHTTLYEVSFVKFQGHFYMTGGNSFLTNIVGVSHSNRSNKMFRLELKKDDPSKLLWKEMRAKLGSARSGHVSIEFEGKLWVIGGKTNDILLADKSVELYDPVTDSFQPGPPLKAAVLLQIFGLQVLAGDLYFASELSTRMTIQKFNKVSRSWELMTCLFDTGRSHRTAAAVGSKIYFQVHGSPDNLSWDGFDVTTGTWEAYTLEGSLPWSRGLMYYHSSATSFPQKTDSVLWTSYLEPHLVPSAVKFKQNI